MLYTHGQELLTRKQLNLIRVPNRDNVSEKWKGVQHGKLATTVVKRLQEAGLTIVNEGWYTNPRDRHDLYGAVDIAADSPGLLEKGVSLDIGQEAVFSMGVRHSNMGRYAVSLAVGARISVCSNGLFSGDFTLKHKHTTDLDLESLIDQGIARYITEADTLENLVNGYRGIDLDDKEAAHFIMTTPDKALHWQYLSDVWDHWQKPPHEEFEPRTAWSLYNAYTETAKKLSVPRQIRMLKGMKPVFDEYVNRN